MTAVLHTAQERRSFSQDAALNLPEAWRDLAQTASSATADDG